MSKKFDPHKDSVFDCLHPDDPPHSNTTGGNQNVTRIQEIQDQAIRRIQTFRNQEAGSSQAVSSIQAIAQEAIRAIENQVGGGGAQGGGHDGERRGAGNRKPLGPPDPSSSSSPEPHSSGAGSSSWSGSGPDHQRKEAGPTSCCRLDDLKKIPKYNMELGDLRFSRSHFVFVDVNVFNNKTLKDRIVPQKGEHQWSHQFVKLPLVQEAGQNAFRQDRTSEVLTQLSSLASAPTLKVQQVAEAIKKYNPKYKTQWTFDALSDFMKAVPEYERKHYQQLFPKIAGLALKMPELVMKAIPLLQRGHTRAITLSQLQIAALLANAFYCTFPHRNTTSPNAEYSNYPSINFSSLFGNWSPRKQEKLRALLHYFTVVTSTKLEGLVTFERRHVKDSPAWESSKETLQKLHVTSAGNIETTGTGLLQVDFACSLIGGGVLGSGLVQEEILFLIHPELIVSRLFVEKLQDKECVLITGVQQFSCYSGYSDSFRWLGNHDDRLHRDEWGRLQRQILAIDAVNFRNRKDQFNMNMIRRELNKAYCGFKKFEGEEHDVATGKWGCGAFNGDPQLKALIQMMVAAQAGRGLAFFTFGDDGLKQEMEQMHHLLVTHHITVETLFGLLDSFCSEQKKKGHHVDVFEFIRKGVKGSRLTTFMNKIRFNLLS